MKKSLVLATVVFTFVYAVALIVRFAGYAFNLLSVPAIIGGIFTGGLLLIEFSDTARKPRLRARSAHKNARHAASPAMSSAVDATSS